MMTKKKPMAWRIKPEKVNIDFTTPEQNMLRKKRLNNLNKWLHRSLESDCLWGIVISKQMFDDLEQRI
jgi:hypothetical protein|tara:strand:- start:1131 stop:1334 length:204 start_codon:yes stop_codon:yes gene_type:complete